MVNFTAVFIFSFSYELNLRSGLSRVGDRFTSRICMPLPASQSLSLRVENCLWPIAARSWFLRATRVMAVLENNPSYLCKTQENWLVSTFVSEPGSRDTFLSRRKPSGPFSFGGKLRSDVRRYRKTGAIPSE
jgi:hypothetical protein